MGTDHDLRASLAAASVRLAEQLRTIDQRLADIEARIDDLEEATDHREAA